MVGSHKFLFTPKQTKVTVYADEEAVSKIGSETQTLLTATTICTLIAFAVIQIAVTARLDALQLIIPEVFVFLVLLMHYCLIAHCLGKVLI